MRKNILRLLMLLIACCHGLSSARACEVADVPKTLKEVDEDARRQFESAEGAYEGIILSSPDESEGGTFWVIQTLKGQNKSFQLVPLPSAGGCVGALGPSGPMDLGILTTPTSDHFDGLLMAQTIENWERQGIIGRGRITIAKVSAAIGALLFILIAGAVWGVKRRRAIAK